MTLHQISEFFAQPAVFEGTVRVLAMGIVIVRYLEYRERRLEQQRADQGAWHRWRTNFIVRGMIRPKGEPVTTKEEDTSEDLGNANWRDLWPWLSLIEKAMIPWIILQVFLLATFNNEPAAKKLVDEYDRFLKERTAKRMRKQQLPVPRGPQGR